MSATAKDVEEGSYAEWSHDTLLTAGSVPGWFIGPVQVLPWAKDTLIISDAVSGQLLWVDYSARLAEPIISRRYRPIAPVFLQRLSDSTILVGGPPHLLELVNVREGTARKLAIPPMRDSVRRVGRFLVGPGGRVVMAPWSGGRFWATPASTIANRPPLLEFDYRRGAVLRRLGPPLTSGTDPQALVPSVEQQLQVLGWTADSLVVADLFSGLVQVYGPNATEIPTRESALPPTFAPRPTLEPTPPARTVFAQFQLAGGAITRAGRMVVLRHTDYRWDHWNPFLHQVGRWTPVLALELYTPDGRLVSRTPLEGTWWRGVRAGSDTDHVLLFSSGDGDDPTFPVVLRYSLP